MRSRTIRELSAVSLVRKASSACWLRRSTHTRCSILSAFCSERSSRFRSAEYIAFSSRSACPARGRSAWSENHPGRHREEVTCQFPISTGRQPAQSAFHCRKAAPTQRSTSDGCPDERNRLYRLPCQFSFCQKD